MNREIFQRIILLKYKSNYLTHKYILLGTFKITDMTPEEKKKHLTYIQCGAVKEQFNVLVYSQGDLVCLDCKEENKESDKRAFDRDMSFR